jgi:transposase-like protein
MEAEKSYNRLVLIGNGFDLALGLKTGYSHFIFMLLKKSALACINKGSFSNGLFSIALNYTSAEREGRRHKIEGCEDIRLLLSRLNDLSFEVVYAHTFFRKIVLKLSSREFNWVDIESEYYSWLIRHFNNHEKRREYTIEHYEAMVELNECMDEIKKELKFYVESQQEIIGAKYIDHIMSDLFDKFFEPLQSEELELLRRKNEESSLEDVMIVNFNYTNTVQRLIECSTVKANLHYLHIHGSVESDDIIFGYGDDTAKDYERLEMEGDDSWLRKIKSFEYPRTENYHNLLNFVENGPFEVFIIGHSCGLSDKTMLKTIFEHTDCIAIRNFHYNGEEEDFYKRIAISRHFEDKAVMRQRVLPFKKYYQIPQVQT